MKSSDFLELKYLSPEMDTIYGGRAFEKMAGLSTAFVKKVDYFIGYMLENGAGRFKVHDFNTKTHDGKDHPNGIAVDIDFTGIPLGNQVVMALLFGWKKIGFYPEWNNPGLHLSNYYNPDPLVWYGFYVEENGVRVQKCAYSSKLPVDVTTRIMGNGKSP